MRSTVIVFPGSNCDRDAAVVLEAVTGRAPTMLWHGETDLGDTDVVVLPGGFCYGDYLRPGAIAAPSPIMSAVSARARDGLPVLGICNGFQVLTEARLLPGALMRNASLTYVCRDVHLRVEQTTAPFLRGYEKDQVIRIPIAHHDGNYFADDATLNALEDGGQVALRYCEEGGAITPDANPNGSRNNIAGILNKEGNVLGMMPHPERLADAALGGTDGRALFEGLLDALAPA
ncbi:MAG: phosphoribosylformylglycinamidine synthase subunit PurQ [Pseudomonadota bacterium]